MQYFASDIYRVKFRLSRFAGSQEKSAFETLLHYVQFFLSLAKKNERNRLSRPLEVSNIYPN